MRILLIFFYINNHKNGMISLRSLRNSIFYNMKEKNIAYLKAYLSAHNKVTDAFLTYS